MILLPTIALLGLTDVETHLALHTIERRLFLAVRTALAAIFLDTTLQNGSGKSVNMHRRMYPAATKCFRKVEMQDVVVSLQLGRDERLVGASKSYKNQVNGSVHRFLLT